MNKINLEDYIGKTIGMVTILKKDEEMSKKKKATFVLCLCECGNHVSIQISSIISKKKLSCGCMKRFNINKHLGKTFNDITVISINEEKTKETDNIYVNCKCSCGEEKVIRLTSVVSGSTRTCGFCQGHHFETHGLTSHPMYNIWKGQYDRCNKPEIKAYKYYGGRGIKCIWTIQEAVEWYNNNPRPTLEHTIDRIDNDGHYEPSNIRWADKYLQATNRDVVKNALGYYKHNNSFVGSIWVYGENIRKNFKTEEEAKNWYDKMNEEKIKEYNKNNS